MPSLTLSRYKLSTFLVCQRRFQLRYLQRLPWPDAPLDARTETAVSRGQQFHQLLERHFLRLPIQAEAIEDDELRGWWEAFQRHMPVLPNGRFLPEMTLTIPIGQHLLTGRFDLLIAGEQAGQPFAHVFDWKTGKARKTADLQQDWQTRLYLAMLAEGGGALMENGRSPAPEQISLTYWYVQQPDQPRTIRYNQAQHQQNWAELQTLVSNIEAHLASQEWPLTPTLSHCQDCAYQLLCDRQQPGTAETAIEEVEDVALEQLEPDLP